MPVAYGDHPRYAGNLVAEIDRILELICNATSTSSESEDCYLDRIRLHLIGFSEELEHRIQQYASGELPPEKICEGIYF